VTAIAVEHLTRRFGEVVAVDDVGFDVGAGEVVALLGQNGAGKTTTLEILEGYLAPSAGAVSVLGFDPRRGDRRWRARIGLVMQSTSLDPELTVREAMHVFAGLFAAARPVDEVVDLIDLAAEADTRIGRLSGGQQRRVDVGLGIVGRPELLFLDEPTTGLDPAARRQTWAIVEQLADSGTTVLLTTHYMDEAERLADRLLVLDGGRLVADATPDALRAASARATVRLPARQHPARRELVVRTSDVTATLEELVDWARANRVDLTGLEVAPPTLEDAYLALTHA
jgi:ABC-2 type transport system ATP-binding protein